MSSALPSPPMAQRAPGEGDTRLHGHWLSLARLGWGIAAVIILGIDVLGTPAVLRQLQTACGSGPCQSPQLTPDQFRQFAASGISPGFYAAYFVALDWLSLLVFVLVATLIIARRSADRMALFGAFTLLVFGGASAYGGMSALPSQNSLWWLPVNLVGVTGQVLFYVFFCLFPSGHFVPRWILWAAVLEAMVQIVGVIPLPAFQSTAIWTLLAFTVLIAVLIVAQVYRYRRISTARERQQTKWVVAGFAVGFGVFIALLLFGNVALGPGARDDPRGTLVANTLFSVLICLVPISIGIAILRSRLWDIDLIIRRTLVYGSLTAILAAIYFGSVIGMQQLTRAITGQQAESNPLVIVLSTLLIAALFSPLRRRLQQTIDRRFYRAKYNAARTLAAFGAALRSETDLNALSAHLVTTVEDTMHPAHVSLWLRPRQKEAAL